MKFTRKELQALDTGAISLASGVRAWILSDPDFMNAFTQDQPGDKCTPSTVNQSAAFPWLIISHPSSSPERISTGVIVDQNDRIRLSLYCISYDACYIFGKAINKFLLGSQSDKLMPPQIVYDEDGSYATLRVAITGKPIRQPEREGLAGEVWKWDLDYLATTGERQLAYN